MSFQPWLVSGVDNASRRSRIKQEMTAASSKEKMESRLLFRQNCERGVGRRPLCNFEVGLGAHRAGIDVFTELFNVTAKSRQHSRLSGVDIIGNQD